MWQILYGATSQREPATIIKDDVGFVTVKYAIVSRESRWASMLYVHLWTAAALGWNMDQLYPGPGTRVANIVLTEMVMSGVMED